MSLFIREDGDVGLPRYPPEHMLHCKRLCVTGCTARLPVCDGYVFHITWIKKSNLNSSLKRRTVTFICARYVQIGTTFKWFLYAYYTVSRTWHFNLLRVDDLPLGSLLRCPRFTEVRPAVHHYEISIRLKKEWMQIGLNIFEVFKLRLLRKYKTKDTTQKQKNVCKNRISGS